MQLYLVRHGQSQNNVGETSAHNVPLTPIGEEQIQCAAEELAELEFDSLYCSPLQRALQSATILASKINVGAYAHPIFSEVGFSWGEPDKTREQLQSAYRDIIFDRSVLPNGWAPASRETETEAYERAGRAIDFLKERHPAETDRVLLVSHGRFGSILIGYVVGTRPRGYSLFSQNNGGISRVDLKDWGATLRWLNATPHLQGTLLT